MDKLTVSVRDHQYDVYVGSNTYELFSTEYAELLSTTDKIGIIADAQVAELHLPLLARSTSTFWSRGIGENRTWRREV